MPPVFMWQTPWYFRKADYLLGNMRTFPLYQLKMGKESGKDRILEVQDTVLKYLIKQNSLTDGKKTKSIQLFSSNSMLQ